MQPNPSALVTTANSRPPAFPPWPQAKMDHSESGTKERTTRSCPCPFSQSWPHHSFSGTLLQSPGDSRWAGENCTNWFRCSGIQCELPVLQRSSTTNSAIGSVIGARGDRGCSHPIPWICRGQPPDPRDHKLQWGCAATGHTHHDLLWDGSSWGWF